MCIFSSMRICLYIAIRPLLTDIRDSNMSLEALRKYDSIHANQKPKRAVSGFYSIRSRLKRLYNTTYIISSFGSCYWVSEIWNYIIIFCRYAPLKPQTQTNSPLIHNSNFAPIKNYYFVIYAFVVLWKSSAKNIIDLRSF